MKFYIVENIKGGGRVFHYDKSMSSKDYKPSMVTRYRTIKGFRNLGKKAFKFISSPGKKSKKKSKKKNEMTGIGAIGNGPDMALGSVPATRRRKKPASLNRRGCR